MAENYQRRTKIVATLGPATDRDNNLEKIILAGANVLRLNFSHGVPEDHIERANKAREIAARVGKSIAILGDLQGPKIRISTFKEGKVNLEKGQSFILDANLGRGEGTIYSVGIDYKELPNDVVPGDVLLLDDGRVILEVVSTNGVQVETIVDFGGILSDKKGINKKGGGLTAPALTDKDKEDIILAAKIGVDYLAVSFPRNGADMRYARSLVEKAGFSPKLVAKVERAEAVASDEAMNDVISSTDVIMVARGDLGVEIGDPQIAAVQKRLIKLSRLSGKVVITATQMMETMIKSPMPTRAEVMDVSNAVIDGTDAVMLSAETASGNFPEEVVRKMSEIAVGAESLPSVKTHHTLNFDIAIDEEGVAKQAVLLANSLKNISAIICLTSSGNTALYASRIKSSIPIYAFSRNPRVCALMSLYRGVYPRSTPEHVDARTHRGALEVIQNLKAEGILKTGEKVVLTQGDTEMKSTNVIRVITVY